MQIKIRRNRDGFFNLADLRRAMTASETVNVYRQGDTWIISRWSEAHRAWVETPCHMLDGERTALCTALHISEGVSHVGDAMLDLETGAVRFQNT